MTASPKTSKDRAVLTLALHKPVYMEMVANLARSFRLWHRESDIRFVLVTDRKDLLPDDLKEIEIVEVTPGEFGYGFSPKLHLDRLAPAEETLFIDADCLCVANLDPVFDKFGGCEVSVVGRKETEGDLFGDIATRCRMVGASWTPRFNGGLYYLRKGVVCAEVFRRARELEARYDEMGLTRLRGVANEEPLVGLGMALCDQAPIPDDGSIKAEPMFFSGQTKIDVFAGLARLYNDPAKPKPFAEWQIPGEARPAIVHFHWSYADQPPYTTEAARLKQVMRNGWPLPLATMYAVLRYSVPFRVVELLKEKLRPVYRRLFGVRAIKKSNRV